MHPPCNTFEVELHNDLLYGRRCSSQKHFDDVAHRHTASDDSATEQSELLGSQSCSSGERSSLVLVRGQASFQGHLHSEGHKWLTTFDVDLVNSTHPKDDRLGVAERCIKETGPAHSGMHPNSFACRRWEDQHECWYASVKASQTCLRVQMLLSRRPPRFASLLVNKSHKGVQAYNAGMQRW